MRNRDGCKYVKPRLCLARDQGVPRSILTTIEIHLEHLCSKASDNLLETTVKSMITKNGDRTKPNRV